MWWARRSEAIATAILWQAADSLGCRTAARTHVQADEVACGRSTFRVGGYAVDHFSAANGRMTGTVIRAAASRRSTIACRRKCTQLRALRAASCNVQFRQRDDHRGAVRHARAKYHAARSATEKLVQLGRTRVVGIFDCYDGLNTNAAPALTRNSASWWLRPTAVAGPRIPRAGARLEC